MTNPSETAMELTEASMASLHRVGEGESLNPVKGHRFPPPPQSVGLLLTYKCTAACDHCCFECTPKREELLSLDSALRSIDALSQIGSVEGITLSGGECFLRYRDMLRIITEARDTGLRVKCVTNAFWARDRRVAREKLEPLVDAGLNTIEVSTDDYHVTYVPLPRVANALEAAHALGIETHLIVIYDRLTRGLEEIRRELALSFEPTVKRGFPLLPVGFAERRIPKERLTVQAALPARPCADVLRRPAISPREEVFVCCAIAGFTPPLRLGRLGDAPLSDLLENARSNPLYMVLALDGPHRLASIAIEAGVFEPNQNFVDECDLCRALLSDEEVVRVLEEEFARNSLYYFVRRDYVESYLSGGEVVRPREAGPTEGRRLCGRRAESSGRR